MAQIVASIEYETASPPAGLPDDMQALPALRCGFKQGTPSVRRQQAALTDAVSAWLAEQDL